MKIRISYLTESLLHPKWLCVSHHPSLCHISRWDLWQSQASPVITIENWYHRMMVTLWVIGGFDVGSVCAVSQLTLQVSQKIPPFPHSLSMTVPYILSYEQMRFVTESCHHNSNLVIDGGLSHRRLWSGMNLARGCMDYKWTEFYDIWCRPFLQQTFILCIAKIRSDL